MRWIVSPRFDLLCFFGGAALSLLFLGLYFAVGVSIVALWWVWLLAFDGPHIGAAFTRTYLDANEWRTRRTLLLVSLLTFAIGPLALAANALTHSNDPFLLYLGFATFYGYYHVVRQHWGFVALYNSVNKDYASMSLDRITLYAGCWAPYAYFLITHPKARALIHLNAPPPFAWIFIAIYAGTILNFIVRARWSNPKTPYLLITVLLYGAIYFAVARYEPVYAHSTGPDQDFLLLSIVIVIFHNVQYLGLVWFHNRNRYSASARRTATNGAPASAGGFGESASAIVHEKSPAEGGAPLRDHGLAHSVNRSPLVYVIACLFFSGAIYFTFACSTGVFPLCRWSDSVRLNQLGLSLWWGLAMNHYYLDQKIWRIRGDSELKAALRLA